MVNVALYIKLEAKTGKEVELVSFLEEQLALVQGDPETVAWFAVRMSPSTFGIFAAFPGDIGKEEYLSGIVSQQINSAASALLVAPPTIQSMEILASKLPGSQDVPDSLG